MKKRLYGLVLLMLIFFCMGMSGCENAKKEENSTNISKLEEAINTYGQYKNDDGKYSVSTYNTLMDCVNKGNSVLNNKKSTQKEINLATKKIIEAADALKEDMWTEPLNDTEKNKVIQQCKTDYGIFHKDTEIISSDLSNWDISIYSDHNNLIVARCNLLDDQGYKLVLAAFSVNGDNLVPHFEWMNYGLIKADEKQVYR